MYIVLVTTKVCHEKEAIRIYVAVQWRFLLCEGLSIPCVDFGTEKQLTGHTIEKFTTWFLVGLVNPTCYNIGLVYLKWFVGKQKIILVGRAEVLNYVLLCMVQFSSIICGSAVFHGMIFSSAMCASGLRRHLCIR